MQNQVPETFADRHVCVIGLGYVGLTLAVAMAEIGFRVHGVEVREDVLAGLRRGEPHFFEPRLAQKLARVVADGALTFGSALEAGSPASVYMITVGTPLDKDGHAQLRSVEAVSREVASAAPDGALVILRSTVKLGTARNVVRPILDASGRRFDLAVCPERTLEGKALTEIYELPQVIGADEPATRMRCMQLFNLVTRTTVAVTSLETAEMVKLVDNTFRDVTFAFANEIAELCGQMGVSAAEVIQAGKLGYARTNVPLPGPVGGPCLEKDPHILVESASAFEVEMPITRASRKINEALPAKAAAHIRGRAAGLAGFADRPTIALLGLAFKGVPATDDLRGTMALPILRALQAEFPGASFRGYDAEVAPDAARDFFGIDPVATIKEAFDGADIVCILNNHPVLRDMDVIGHARLMRAPAIVYDFWNLFAFTDPLPADVSYLALGSERIDSRRDT